MSRCPRCLESIHRGAKKCPHCDFSATDAELEFIACSQKKITTLNDEMGLFSLAERRLLHKKTERFRERFPELFLVIHTGKLNTRDQVQRFGFWMINQATYLDLEPESKREGCVFIGYYPEVHAAGISFGYMLDDYLNEKITHQALLRAHPHWLEKRCAEGVVKIIDYLTYHLLKVGSSKHV